MWRSSGADVQTAAEYSTGLLSELSLIYYNGSTLTGDLATSDIFI